MDIFRRKFDYFSHNVSAMDELFEASFSSIAESGRFFSKCGNCSRYMKYIASRPQRLYCMQCEKTYSLPLKGTIKLYKVFCYLCLHVCACVYMYVQLFMWVCMCLCGCACVYVGVHVFTCMCRCLCGCACVYVGVYVDVHVFTCMCRCLCGCACVYVGVHVFMWMCMCLHVCAGVYVGVQVFTCMCVFTCLYCVYFLVL